MVTSDGVQVTPLQPLAFKLHDAVIYSGLSRSRLYDLFKSGQLASFQVGGRRMIFRSAIDTYFAKLTEAA